MCSIPKNEWGPNAWTFLHSISFAYPDNPSDDEKQSCQNFFQSLKNLLPCPECKKHYTGRLPHSIPCQNKDELAQFVAKLHNSVNKMLDKKEWTYKQVLDKYSSHNASLCASCTTDHRIHGLNKTGFVLAIIFLITTILYLVYKACSRRR